MPYVWRLLEPTRRTKWQGFLNFKVPAHLFARERRGLGGVVEACFPTTTGHQNRLFHVTNKDATTVRFPPPDPILALRANLS
jgi:hypothetical protein